MTPQSDEFLDAETDAQHEEAERIAARDRRTLWIAGICAAVLCLSLIGTLVAVLVTNGNVSEEAEKDAQRAQDLAAVAQAQADANKQTLESIIRAEVLECEGDRKARIQGKERAMATEHLLTHLIGLIQASPVSDVDPAGSQAAIDQFRDDLQDIVILPLPECGELEQDLRDTLGADGSRTNKQKRGESKPGASDNEPRAQVPRPEAQRTLDDPVQIRTTAVSGTAVPETESEGGSSGDGGGGTTPQIGGTPPVGNPPEPSPPGIQPPAGGEPSPPGGVADETVETLEEGIGTLCGVAGVDCPVPELPLPKSVRRTLDTAHR